MVEVHRLKKVFKLTSKQVKQMGAKDKYKMAVENVSFRAVPGQIFGLLGPNGAGKTTTLRCIATLLKPTEGQIWVGGAEAAKAPEDVRRKIAFLTHELKLEGYFTPKYTMAFFGKLYGMSEDAIEARIDYLFEVFGIKAFEASKIADLSTGMKQKLSIAVSLIHDPEVIIFDEPTNGLDIVTAKAVTDYLVTLKNEGKTVIISTHIMSIAEKLCDSLVIILGGKVIAAGTVTQIVDGMKAFDLEEAFFKLYSLHQRRSQV